MNTGSTEAVEQPSQGDPPVVPAHLSRKLMLGAIGLTMVVLVVTLVLALRWQSQPFPGFVVEQTLVVGGYRGQGWGRDTGRLPDHPERVEAIAGEEVTTIGEFHATLKRRVPGEEISVKTVSPDGTRRLYRVTVRPCLPVSDRLRLFWLPWAVGLAYLGIGLWVYALQGDTRAGRAFMLFCLFTSLSNGLIFDLISTHVFTAVWAFSVAQTGAALISLALLFPQPWAVVRRRPWLSLLPYGVSALLAQWELLALNRYASPWAYIPAWRAGYLFAGFGVLVLVATMWYRLRSAQRPIERQQALVILAGAVIAFTPLLVWFVRPLLDIAIRLETIHVSLPLLAFPIAIALAILRYHLWDLDLIINRTLIYGVLIMILGGTFLATVFGMQLAFQRLTGQRSPMAVAISTLLIAVLFDPLRQRIKAFIDRRFYRERYDAAQMLTMFAATVRNEVELHQLSDRLCESVTGALHPAHVATWVRMPEGFVPYDPLDCSSGADVSVAALGEQSAVALDDPLVDYLTEEDAPVMVDDVPFSSPGVRVFADSRTYIGHETELLVPLVCQSKLVGWLALGLLLSGRPYTANDRAVLRHLAMQAGPAIRVAQLVREREREAVERERIKQELAVARVVQETLLPRHLPLVSGWDLAVHWEPARAVGGDFYDFLLSDQGELFIVMADVSDKGIPAALVMASARAIFRGLARWRVEPAQALRRANELLRPELPPGMFVTCFYGLLEIRTGRFRFANAGHNPPFLQHAGGTSELWASGMPLGWMDEVAYDEHERIIGRGDLLSFYSDGLTESHNPEGEMFDLDRLERALKGDYESASELVEALWRALQDFAGPGWNQEDDVTLAVLRRLPAEVPAGENAPGEELLTTFEIQSELGNERVAMEKVEKAVRPVLTSDAEVEAVKTAVAEAVMNAIEHGNGLRVELPVIVDVLVTAGDLVIRIADQGLGRGVPAATVPDLDAKLEGRQSPRGWGLFLIREMVDDVETKLEDGRHILELRVRLDNGKR